MKKWLVLGVLLLVGVIILATKVCLPAVFRYGLWVDRCPDGELRQTVVANGTFQRGGASPLYVSAYAHYTTGDSDSQTQVPMNEFSPEVQLVGLGVDQKLQPKRPFEKTGDSMWGELEIPRVNDGDYVLRVKVHSNLGESSVDLPLPLYAPARVHLITDRPLYEPGNTVRFRALALKAIDLSPLDGRPGTFRVFDPNGEVLLEEKASAGEWGVVEGNFPLDSEAQSGDWRVTWSSGSASESRSFTVKPFTLPRFRIEASAKKPFYRRRERPVLKGEVRYASGAPVAKAKVELNWQVGGDWPPPTSWVDGSALPKLATTDASGSFTVELPAVPEDLQKQATLTAMLAAVDDSGDRVEGAASILLSEDAIKVEAVPELEGGLVEGFNNRLYLRATTADGRVLDGASLHVKRLWEPSDKGVTEPSDEDGVAALQLDPGPPVNVVIPAQPFRPPPRAKPVTRTGLEDLISDEGEPTLGDRLAFDRLEARVAECTRYVGNDSQVTLGVRIATSGKVAGIAAPSTKLGACVSKVVQSVATPAGKDRLLTASYTFDDSDLPALSAQPEGVPDVPESLMAALNEALIDVRDCLPPTVSSGTLPRMIAWSYAPGAKEVGVSWIAATDAMRGFPEAPMRCIEQRLGKISLPKRAGADDLEGPDSAAIGYARLTVEAPEKYESVRPQATTLVGYEFLVTAKLGNEVLGTTKLLMTPGTIPNLRVRATPQIVNPGEPIQVDVLRGPDFQGDLPTAAWLSRAGFDRIEAKLDEKTRRAQFVAPADAEGWASIEVSGAHTFIFVRPKAQLAVKVTPDKERYAPGQTAVLELATTIGSKGGPAAVGLFGVDNSLAQLVALPGPGELNGLRPSVSASTAFPGLDAQALTMGRVRGKNAAAATLLKVSSLPPAAELEAPVTASAQTWFDPLEGLTDHFYAVLNELHRQTREWETTAPETEKMTPQKMAALWAKAVETTAAGPDKTAGRDAWGRPLRLHRLPADLLALTEPRQVVVVGTRLPEDTENWNTFVRREKP
ncbi:MAG: hypothetical protein JNK82_24180 [Myxococcaceae bacterium]|nr:hypothetical protein [Myxococcaceae bacterium]